jgi:pimeloyl-ACP methyl ester carboxylesterase
MEQICWMRQELMANPAALSYVIDRQRPEDAIDTVEKEIHRLNVPTLVIAAEADETIPLWHSETYANEIPGAQLQIVAGADHSLPQKHPTELAQAIQQFLQHQSLPNAQS